MDRNTMKNLYKSRNDPIRNIEKKRNDDSKKMKIMRQDRRTRMFNERRSITGQDDRENLSENTSTTDKTLNSSKDVKAEARKLALQKYVLEKEAIKQALNIKKKPPFVVGIPHHGNSPILKKVGTQKNVLKPLQEEKNKRVTRATSKFQQGNVHQEKAFVFKSPVRVFPFNERKSVFAFQAKVSTLKKLTSPHTPTVLKRSTQKIKESTRQNTGISNNVKNEIKNPKMLSKVSRKVLQPVKKSSTSSTDSGQPLASPTDSGQPLASPLTNSGPNEINVQEAETDIPNCQMQSSPVQQISVKSEVSEELGEIDRETTLQREKVDNESGRLLSLAEEWESIALKTIIPRDVVDEIDSVVGQTRLLTRDKFNQFRRLVDQYESQQGSHKITVEDLNGFWDMMFLQVELLIKRYTKLDVLKSNNWEEPKAVTPTKKKRKNYQKKKVIKVEEVIPNKQESSPPIAMEEDLTMKASNNEKKHVQIMNLSRHSYTPRRHSPSPYIAMRLSGVGRSLNEPFPTVVETFECTPKNIKTEPNSGDIAVEKFVLNAQESVEAVERTPRRSLRLVGRTPIQQIKVCSSCQSPDCSTSSGCQNQNDISVKSRRSRQSKRRCAVSPVLKEEAIQPEPSNSANMQDEEVISRKRFVLRPSNLVFNDTSNKTPLPEKTRRTYVVGKENQLLIDRNVETTGITRRSSRIASAKKVSFISSPKEKVNFKLPATPFTKKGRNHESFSDSFSD